MQNTPSALRAPPPNADSKISIDHEESLCRIWGRKGGGKMGKGVTLSTEELRALKELLKTMDP